MIGRAGRPQFDNSAVAILFVQDIKKEYYKKFLYEPFPVESHMLEVFPYHLNAEIAAGTVQYETMEYLSSTYLYHRIIKNPSFYGVDLSEIDSEAEGNCSELAINTLVVKFLSDFIDKCVKKLEDDYCVLCVQEDSENLKNLDIFVPDSKSYQKLISTPLGKISSFYYLSTSTIRMFQDALGTRFNDFNQQQLPYLNQSAILDLLTQASEYMTLPVRHNEEFLNEELSKRCPFKFSRRSMESPHTKANLLIQAHCSRLRLPIVDYYTDLKTVLDQAIRIMQAMIDISALNGSLPTTLNIICLQQCILQGSWQHNQLITLTETENNSSQSYDNDLNNASQYFDDLQNLNNPMELNQISNELSSVAHLVYIIHSSVNSLTPIHALRNLFSPYQIDDRIIDRIYKSLLQLPFIELEEIFLTEADSDKDQVKISISKEEIFKPSNVISWLNLKQNTNYLIHCRFLRKKHNCQLRTRIRSQKAFCPRFPKPKSESWFLVLGVKEKSELITMSRVPIIQSSHSTNLALQFCTPTNSVQNNDQRILYSIYLLSDCYIGLDQQYYLPVNIQSITERVNLN